MIRGRHRGLPVAIDRAIVLPHEYNRKGEDYVLDAFRPNDAELGTNLAEDQSTKRQENGNSVLIDEQTSHEPEKHQRRVSIA